MDLQRNILIVALVVVSYFLFLAWQEDYGARHEATLPAGETAAQTAIASAPVNEVRNESGAGDLANLAPAASSTNDNQALLPDSPDTKVARIVRVRTDVLDLSIDLDGGDIVSLMLPHYPLVLDSPEKPVQLMSTGSTTYVAQSGLVSDVGPDFRSSSQRGQYTASSGSFSMSEGQDSLEVVLSTTLANGILVDKVFRFRRGDYLVDVRYRVRNEGPSTWNGFLFGQIKRDLSNDPSHPDGNSFLTGSPTYLGGAYHSDEEVYKKLTFGDVDEKALADDVQGGWIAFIQHYFVAAWVPDQKALNHFSARKTEDGKHYLFGFTSPQFSVAPGAVAETGVSFYAGPKFQDRLRPISPGLDLTVDYGWFWFISQPLLWLLVHIEQIVGNWGLAIILLTVLVKLAFFYPSKISYESMAHMRRVTPELTRIREEYKNDRQKQSQEMLALYRREKINPLGGCLPILIQMPVFIALYWVLLESVELRQAPFFLWIKDLSVMDPYFILPILMGISMFLQTKLNPPPPDPMQAKILQWMPWIFTVFFLFFASGLVLYWLVNNVLSICQQWYITRKIERQHAKA